MSGPSTSTGWEAAADLVVIGSGVAGLTAALEATRLGLRVLVVTKAAADDGNTRWAQGGVAVVLPGEHDADDSVRRHIDDTLEAGVGLCDPIAVTTILADGPSAVAAFRQRGARFDARPDGQLSRSREGGHTAFRVVHAGGDATGAEVQRALLVNASERRIALLERHVAADLVRTRSGAVAGVLVLDDDGVPGVVRAPAVVLATGGLGQLYQATSNPEVATADGVALGLRAGAAVADLEFVQFHPTVLFTGRDAMGRRPLVTEAVRGEGAVLIDATGERVMKGVHPLEDLAPRDVVSSAVNRRMASAPGGVSDHVFLDATMIEDFASRFPTVQAACAASGIDPAHEPIPVAPAAHFGSGGVVTTVDGRTSVRGLYAAGEVARTGLHGANRLASNSLLEGLVVGARVARAAVADRLSGLLADLTALDVPVALPLLLAPSDRAVLQQLMSRHAGIGRDAHGLATIRKTLDSISVARVVDSRTSVEDAALEIVARALVLLASAREESRGSHLRTDYPGRDDQHWRRSLTARLDDTGVPMLCGELALGGAA
ncbi:L-aspartate oxidase [Flindersiella endophytica]